MEAAWHAVGRVANDCSSAIFRPKCLSSIERACQVASEVGRGAAEELQAIIEVRHTYDSL